MTGANVSLSRTENVRRRVPGAMSAGSFRNRFAASNSPFAAPVAMPSLGRNAAATSPKPARTRPVSASPTRSSSTR